MRTMTACLSVCAFLITLTTLAQPPRSSVGTGTEVNLEREIRLEDKSEPQVLILNVEEHVNLFHLTINSTVTAGTLNIEVYNPQGHSHGAFSVGTQLDKVDTERVHGSIKRSLKNPRSGNWKVKITPRKATGKIVIQTSSAY